jgi:hypothetical protein
MRKRSLNTAVIVVVFVHVIASLACSNPIQRYFFTQATAQGSAAENLFAANQTNTKTHSQIQILTPSGTAKPTGIETKALATADTSLGTAIPRPSEKDRFIETAAVTEFSYIPPAGWNKVPPSDTELLTSWLEPSESCLLHFFAAKLDGSAEQYALASLELKKAELHAEVISQGKFVNYAGLDAYKVVMAYSSEGSNLQVTQYFFQNRGYLVIATYIRGYHERKDQDPVVDVSMETLRDE